MKSLQTDATRTRIPFLTAVAAFVAGVLLTALVLMTLLRPTVTGTTTTVASPDAHGEQHADEADPDGESGVVCLTPEGEKAAGIRLQAVAARTLRKMLAFSGTIEARADRVARITPPVPGRLVRVLVRLGDTVRAGDPVAVIDSPEVAQAHAAEHGAEADVRQAEAAIQTARARVGQAQTQVISARAALKTQQGLARAGAFSQAPLQEARAELSDSQSALLAAQTELASHTVQLQRTERLFREGIVSRAELEQTQLERRQDEARLQQAQVRVETARQALARAQRVAESGLLNRQALQAAEADLRAAESEVTRARREEEAARTALAGERQSLEAIRTTLAALEGAGGHVEGDSSRVTLHAPFGGVVSEVSATLGETLERGSALMTLDDLAAVLVLARVPEKDIAQVRSGQRVEVSVAAYPGVRFAGVVRSLASRVDPKTRTLAVRCVVGNPQRRLRPEMFARVYLSAGRERRAVLTVPETAVVTERDNNGADETQIIFVAAPGGEREYFRREVEVGDAPMDGVVEVKSGLKAGEKVVAEGAYTLLSEARKEALAEEGHAH